MGIKPGNNRYSHNIYTVPFDDDAVTPPGSNGSAPTTWGTKGLSPELYS